MPARRSLVARGGMLRTGNLSEGTPRMKIIAVAGAKGGIGKTTTAIALATELARRGVLTYLQDLDPQGSATMALNHELTGDPWEGTPIPVPTERNGAGRPFLLGRGSRLLAHIEPEGILKLLAPMTIYEGTIVLDCPPTLGTATLAALKLADLVLVPLQPTPIDIPALVDVHATLTGLGQHKPLLALLTRVQGRRSLALEVPELILQEFGTETLLATQIPEDAKAAEAPGHGLPVAVYAPRSRAALAYHALADELLQEAPWLFTPAAANRVYGGLR